MAKKAPMTLLSVTGEIIHAIEWECPECGATNVQPVANAPNLDHVSRRYCGHCNEQFTIDLIIRMPKNVQ